MKSNIKKEYVLKYLQNKFSSTSQDVGFLIGSYGNPLYGMMSKEGSEGIPNELSFVDADTYVKSKEQYIPVSIPIIQADYATITDIEQSNFVTASSWSVMVEFLVFAGSSIHDQFMFAMEEFRDKMLNKIDFLEGREFDYASTSTKPIQKWYITTTTAGDVVPNGIVTINGSEYIIYNLSIDIDISDNIPYGQQFEFYMKKGTDTTYQRILPLQTSWGASNSVDGEQLLNNTALSASDTYKSQAVHSIVQSRGVAFAFSILFDDTKDILVDLITETYKYKNVMNNTYNFKMVYKKKQVVAGVPSFVTDTRIGFDIPVIIPEGGVDVVYGDNITLSVSLVPSWIREVAE